MNDGTDTVEELHGSAFLQRKYPLEAMSTYLDGLHIYADDTGRQVHAAHFCIH